MFSSFLFYGIFLKNRCSSCSILVDIAIFISSSLLLYQLLSNQESRNHSLDTLSRKGFNARGLLQRCWKGWKHKRRERGCLWRSKKEKGVCYPKIRKLPLGWSPGVCTHRHLWTVAATAGAILQEPRSQHFAGAARARVQLPAVLHSCSLLLLQTDAKQEKNVVCLFLPPVSSLGQNLVGGQLAKESGKYIQ